MIFILGIIVLFVSEILIKYTGNNLTQDIFILIFPIIIFLLIYLFVLKKELQCMKVYIKYIIKNFIKLLFIVSAIFFILVLLLNLLQELDFFKNTNESLYYPLLLNILNAPSILIDIFPFIFLISTQFLLINLIEKNELIVLKNFGIDNL